MVHQATPSEVLNSSTSRQQVEPNSDALQTAGLRGLTEPGLLGMWPAYIRPAHMMIAQLYEAMMAGRLQTSLDRNQPDQILIIGNTLYT